MYKKNFQDILQQTPSFQDVKVRKIYTLTKDARKLVTDGWSFMVFKNPGFKTSVISPETVYKKYLTRQTIKNN
jgi:hypothetical protein